jgi:hypothetical protein
MVIGVVAIQRNRISIAMQLIAIAHIVCLGVLTHTQARYIFFATVLLVIRAVDVLGSLGPRLGRLRGPAIAAAFAIVSSISIFAVYKAIRYRHVRGDLLRPTMLATAAIREDVKGAACEVLGRRQTELEWYSGCTGVLLVPTDSIAAGKHVYAVWDNSGGPSQPDLSALPGTFVLQIPGVVGVRRLSP